MRRLLDKYYRNKSNYYKNALTLLSGTAASQAILLLFTPVLSRLYSPSDFGVLTLMLSVINILSIPATGRYELAILLPKNEEWAKQLIKLIGVISICFCAVLFIPIVVIHTFFLESFNLSRLDWLLFLIPIFVFVNANLNMILYWANRNEQYKIMAGNKILENLTGSILNVILGIVGFSKGLIIGRSTGQFIALYRYIGRIHKEVKLFKIDLKKLKFVGRRYNRFPKYLIASHLLNTGAIEVPSLLINVLFGNAVLGFYGFSNRVATIPLTLMSRSLGNVFRERAAKDYMQNGECLEIYMRTFKALLKISIVPFIIFFITAPYLFALVFGNEWTTAGEYARYLTPMYFFQFLSNPLSSMFAIAERQKTDLAWQVSLFVCNVLTLLVFSKLFSVKIALIAFSISYSVMYIINLRISHRLSKGLKY